MSKKNRPFIGMSSDMYWQSPSFTNRMYNMYRNQILSLALTRFEWHGLPPTCNARFLEWTLLTQGQATISFPKDQEGVFYSTQVTWQGAPNIYDNPPRWISIGNNGWRFEASPLTGVVVWDNLLRAPILDAIDLMARELTDLSRTEQINRLHQKTPYILTGPQDKKIDMTNLWKQIAGGEPAVIGTDGLSQIEVSAIKTDVPYLASEIDAAIQNCWTRIYQLLGIDSLPFKQERQVEDEIISQQTPSSVQALGFLAARREAAEVLNTRFEQYLTEPITVTMREDWESDNWNMAHNIKDRLEAEDGSVTDLKEED